MFVLDEKSRIYIGTLYTHAIYHLHVFEILYRKTNLNKTLLTKREKTGGK